MGIWGTYACICLFTSIHLDETIDIAVNTLIDKERDLNISRTNLK